MIELGRNLIAWLNFWYSTDAICFDDTNPNMPAAGGRFSKGMEAWQSAHAVVTQTQILVAPVGERRRSKSCR